MGAGGIIGRDHSLSNIYFMKNAHGDVLGAYAGNGITKVADYTYDAWGNQTNESYSWWADENPIRYAGEYYDTESGLIYLRARYYDSSMGRFLSEDPIKDGVNWYAYCGNNPIMFVDPSGLAPQTESSFVIQQLAELLYLKVSYESQAKEYYAEGGPYGDNAEAYEAALKQTHEAANVIRKEILESDYLNKPENSDLKQLFADVLSKEGSATIEETSTLYCALYYTLSEISRENGYEGADLSYGAIYKEYADKLQDGVLYFVHTSGFSRAKFMDFTTKWFGSSNFGTEFGGFRWNNKWIIYADPLSDQEQKWRAPKDS